jgi:hypothetical protein
MPALAVPIAECQIQAATALHGLLTGWTAIDAALAQLVERLAAFELKSALIKVASVNQLYENVYAVVRMAEHIAPTLNDSDPLVGANAARLRN